MEVRGRDLGSGIPKEITLTEKQIAESLVDPVNQIIEAIKVALESAPPELSADIVESGIIGTLLFASFIISLLLSCIKNKYQIFIIVAFLLIGMFYNVFELQNLCYILYLSIILFNLEESKISTKKTA